MYLGNDVKTRKLIKGSTYLLRDNKKYIYSDITDLDDGIKRLNDVEWVEVDYIFTMEEVLDE